MIFKYDQGHWQWYEQVKPNEQYMKHHSKFAICHIYGGGQQNCYIKVFDPLDIQLAGLLAVQTGIITKTHLKFIVWIKQTNKQTDNKSL